MIRIGVDLGGTKIEAVVLEDPETRGGGASGWRRPRELARARVPTDRDRGYGPVLATTAALLRDVASQAGVELPATAIGVGMPGSVTRRRADGSTSELLLVKNSNTTCLNGRSFHHDLKEAIGCPIAFANDANCFALAEATWGAAREARVSFGVILGTGVGGGLCFRDASGRAQAWNGAQGIAGEWGHIPLEPVSGPECYCGRRGCIEQYLSGPAIEAEYTRRSGTKLPLVAIAASADALARALVEERIELFGRAIAIVIDIVDPDVVVLGGGVSNIEAFTTGAPAAIGRWIFNDAVETVLAKNELGDSAGVLGAALLPV